MSPKQSLTDKAYKAIKADILTGALKPGTLVVQSQMVEEYAIGVTPIRGALHRLTYDGYVEALPRYGYKVTSITLSDVREIYELRGIIEAEAACLAVQRASQEQLDRILHIAENSAFAYTHQQRASYTEFLRLNSRFHVSIVQSTGNGKMTELLSSLLEELSRAFHLYLDVRDYAPKLREEHRAIAHALQRRDAKRASELVQQQIEHSLERTVEALRRQHADHFVA